MYDFFDVTLTPVYTSVTRGDAKKLQRTLALFGHEFFLTRHVTR